MNIYGSGKKLMHNIPHFVQSSDLYQKKFGVPCDRVVKQILGGKCKLCPVSVQSLFKIKTMDRVLTDI